MQLDQILSAAVAAVNVEEVEQLPSPDIPQNSPTPPASARDHRVLHYLPGHGLASTPFEGTPLEAQTEVEGLCHYPPEVPPQELTDVGHTDSTPACASAAEVQHLIDLDTKEAMQVYHEALQDAQPPPDGDLGDMNFFALDDNLVITSQQALEMFESPPAMDYGATYHVLTASENPPQVNTPPMEVGGAVCPEGPTPSEILAQEEIPIQEEVLLQGVGPAPTDVPVPSAEIEVLTTPDVPQYTALAPASATADGAIDLIAPDALQCLPGTALDATVDAEGRFVVQVTAPGINMTVPNRYVGSEDIVVQLPCVAASPPGAEARPHDPPSSTGPYTTQGECPSVYSGPALGRRERPSQATSGAKGGGQRERASKGGGASRPAAQEPVRDRSDVLTALRESIFRSRAKKRGRGTEGGADKAPKRRPLTPRAEDVCGTKDSGERHEGGRYGVDGPSHYTYETTKRTPHTPAPVSSAAAPYGYDAPAESAPRRSQPRQPAGHGAAAHHRHCQNNGSSTTTNSDNNNNGGMMVLRPEELLSALQRGGQGPASPLVVMRPEDLHAGSPDAGDPLQVQLVYLVYPMEGAGSATRPVPTEMAPHKAFPRDGQEPPSATNKQVPWLPRERHHENHSTTLTPLRSSFEKNNQQEKPIAEWTYEDVVFFIFKAQEDLNLDSKNLDVNFSELSGSTGEDLLNMDIEGFKRFSKGYGEQYYRYFIEMRDEERRLELQRHEEIQRREELRRQEEERRQSLVSSHQMLYKSHLFSPTSYEYLVSPSSQGQAAHLPSPSPREAPPTLIETQAPYEIRYEAPRSMAMENGHRSGISDSLPTASMKTFPLFSSTSPSNHYHSVADSLSDPDHSAAEEEEPKPEVPKKRGPGRPRKPENELKKKKKKTGRLWEFIRNLLLDPETCPSMVKWENPEEGIFRFVQAEKVAQKWGERKQNKDMNYEKLSRAMRYYYKGGVFEAVLGRRLVYKFGKNAKNWRPSNPNFANPPAM